jgi:ferredoxin/flavodoxin
MADPQGICIPTEHAINIFLFQSTLTGQHRHQNINILVKRGSTMQNRRKFMKTSAAAAMALSIPSLYGCINIGTIRSGFPMKPTPVKKAVVLWYSQTGYTERNGKLLARALGKREIALSASDIRDFDKTLIRDADLVVLGSPVFYYDTPEFVKTWIRSLPDLRGKAVAAYVTFGGPEGNQHNAACSILGLLADKNGVPVGIDTFMNMSAFPLSWSKESVHEKTWLSRDLPNEKTFNRVREYANILVHRVEKGESAVYTRKLTLRESSILLGPIWWTKRFVKNHSIDRDKCIECGTCVKKCPADAIDLSEFAINRKACVLCFGCINNCPAQAVHMEYNGEKVIGYHDFLKLKNLKIAEPGDPV